MTESNRTHDVIIIGGGPVGLFLAILLRKKGIKCIVMEKRTARTTHSKSLGIHPVSLELMEQMEIADPFVEEGIKIRRGIAMDDHGIIGTISFDSCPKPFPYVLSLPQYRTEYILEKKLEKLDSNCLCRGVEFQDLDQTNEGVNLTVKEGKKSYQLSTRLLVGCDGKNSVVRQSAGFSFEGRAYPDTYIMGDFSDTTDFGTSAVIYLHNRGLIESFPLIDNRRRWVIKTDKYYENLNRRHLEKILKERIGLSLNGCDHFMLSSFGVQKHLANPMAQNRVYLAGDSAHVVSPIGGQGMNLGWLDSRELANRIEKLLSGNESYNLTAEQYTVSRVRVAKKVIRRAELNMALGRKSMHPIKTKLVWLMVNTPLEKLLAQLFTMRGLQNWPI